MIRQYRLEGVFAVFALLAALYVWKNATPMLPRTSENSRKEGYADTIAGRNTTEGFVNLLRRSLPPTRIVSVCVEEWNTSFAHLRGNAEQPAAEKDADPVTQFSQLAQKLSNKKRI